MSQRVFDLEGVMTRLDNDRELLFELVDIFLSDYQSQLKTIQTAITAKDAKALRDSAHAIKGALGNIGAMLAHDYAFELETAGRSEELAGVQDVFPKLSTAISEFIKEINKYRAQS